MKMTEFGWQLAHYYNGSKKPVSKIFGIGLSRTGTTSCYHLMKQFGFTSVHYPSSMQEIDAHFFCNDTPISARFEELDRLYPNARFIYTTRCAERWAASCVKHFSKPERLKHISAMPEELKTWYDYGDLNLYGCDMHGLASITEAQLVAAYFKHEERVKNYFKNRPSDLLIIDVTKRDGKPLTQFIEFLEEVHLVSIPQTNANYAPYSPAWKL